MASGRPAETLRIVMLGKTGNGKSSLGNALLGIKPPKKDSPKEGFAVGRGLKSETRECKWNRAIRFGAFVEVTDTPGLCDTHLEEEVIHKELAKSVACAVPGPNIIIFALRCDRRFTKEEYLAYTKVKQLFSDDIDKFLIVVFNGMDQIIADPESDEDEEKTKEERQAEERRRTEQQKGELAKEVKKYGPPLHSVIQAADGRYFGMNNKASPAERDRQVQQLIAMMHDVMKKNRGVFYRTEMIDEINRRVEEMARQQAADFRRSQNDAMDELRKKRDVSYKTEMMEEVNRRVVEMARQQAADFRQYQDDAMVNLKRDIAEEKVKPGFLDSLKGTVTQAASNVKDGVKKICSVM